MQIEEILIKKGAIPAEEVERLRGRSKETGIPLEKLIKAFGVPDIEINQAKAEMINIPYKKISEKEVSFDLIKQIPEESLRHYQFLPLAVRDDTLEIGMVNPEDIDAREAIQFIVSRFNRPFQIFLISQEDFDSIFGEYDKGLKGEVSQVLGELESALSESIRTIEDEEIFKKDIKFIEDAPVTKMVAVILKHAISGNASDIHIEPQRVKLKVRFRVDGILYTSLLLPLNVHEAIISRIKILTNMRLDEKRKPQDGRFEARIDGREIDFRVSSLPTFFGEKMAIRILDRQKGVRSLEEIGFSKDDLVIVREALKKPYGMILLTGPTGSGKTTTLYGMLQELDKETRNVISLEDPVEYNVEGVNQSQVKPEIGYDFANGLRSVLRQDPDMIMVGEIRDKETAALAIQAALTGHLVFSTLHTNNAVGVIPRLVDMGVDPFLIAPTLLMAISQRLVRTLCLDSKKPMEFSGPIREKINKELSGLPANIKAKIKFPDKIYQGIPSAVCPQGFRGRTGVFEILTRTPEMENIILTNPVDIEILKEARRQGMMTLREAATVKFLNGEIGFDEINNL
ncbi:MAG: GspE/PulE family protein [Patescibacteria group bacterium]